VRRPAFATARGGRLRSTAATLLRLAELLVGHRSPDQIGNI